MMDFLQPISVRADVHRLSKKMFEDHLKATDVVYDIGCGQKPFADFLKGRVKSHIGVDLADGFYKPDQVDIIGTAYAVPVPDNCADAVISSQVIEHLETPLIAIQETYRILKSGGLLFLSFPFLHPIHAAPRDFMRYTEFYVRQEIASDKFEVLDMKRIGGFWYMIGMYFGIYLYQFDRGIIKKLYIAHILNSIVSIICRSLQLIEETMLKAVGKNIENYHMKWTLNYVCLLKKK